MKKQIVVNVQVHESRIAILEDGHLVELEVERPDQRRLIGNIYKGRVEQVLPGIQSAFIDIGLDKRAFLHISDVARFDPFADSDVDEEESHHQRRNSYHSQNIQDFCRSGEEILIQITKEPMGTKGPRCTSEIALAGRYLVLMPGQNHVGVSRKISSQKERRRIHQIIRELKPDGGIALIGRSAAEEQSREVLERDLNYLLKDWEDIKKKADVLDAPALLYKDMGMIVAMVRDLFSSDMNEFILDSKVEFERIKKYAKKVVPNLANRIKLYDDAIPIFDAYQVEEQIENMLKRKIWLKKGASIVIDNAEAMIAIDVNSGRNVGRGRGYEDTLLQVNLAAVDEIARQLRLRDLGGIIVIDFIDMESEKNRNILMEAFKNAMSSDRAKHRILPMNEFGMVVLTRQRVRQSIIERLSNPCPTCGGFGVVFSPVTVIARLERWLMRAKESDRKGFLILANPIVAEELIAEGKQRLHELENSYKVKLECFADPTIDPDEFAMIDGDTGEDMTTEFSG